MEIAAYTMKTQQAGHNKAEQSKLNAEFDKTLFEKYQGTEDKLQQEQQAQFRAFNRRPNSEKKHRRG